jgi:acyl transferase domain-containing protein
VERVIEEAGLQVACYNTPNNINVAGPLSKLEQAKSQFKSMKITCLFLPVSAAFHCPMLQGMVEPFRDVLRAVDFKEPQAKILRNLDGQIYQQLEDIKFGLL